MNDDDFNLPLSDCGVKKYEVVKTPQQMSRRVSPGVALSRCRRGTHRGMIRWDMTRRKEGRARGVNENHKDSSGGFMMEVGSEHNPRPLEFVSLGVWETLLKEYN